MHSTSCQSGAWWRDHNTPVLHSLHSYAGYTSQATNQIQGCLVFQSLSGQAPEYLTSDCHLVAYLWTWECALFRVHTIISMTAVLKSVAPVCGTLYLTTSGKLKSVTNISNGSSKLFYLGTTAHCDLLIAYMRLWVFLLTYLFTYLV